MSLFDLETNPYYILFDDRFIKSVATDKWYISICLFGYYWPLLYVPVFYYKDSIYIFSALIVLVIPKIIWHYMCTCLVFETSISCQSPTKMILCCASDLLHAVTLSLYVELRVRDGMKWKTSIIFKDTKYKSHTSLRALFVSLLHNMYFVFPFHLLFPENKRNLKLIFKLNFHNF